MRRLPRRISSAFGSAVVGRAAQGLWVGVLLSVLAPTAANAQASQTFNFTGTSQSFVVPNGVTHITVDASGAQGGRGAGPTQSAGGLAGGCSLRLR